MNKYINQKDAAKFFNVTARTIRNWEVQGVLTPLRIGGKVYYDKSKLEAMFNPLNTSNDE